MILDFEKFSEILNREIFEESKQKLIINIAKDTERYLGLFRPTKPKAKILQNLLQSHEIRFGNAFEVLIEEYLKKLNYETLEKEFKGGTREKLMVDLIFRKKNNVYFIEQKIRDDHDSTKKRGQIENFEKKLNVIIKKYGEKNLSGIFYFIDPDIKKNKNYYSDELEKMSKDYGINLYLHYGNELFQFLGYPQVWEEILGYLKKWKESIPDLPEINFDLNAQSSFEEIKDINTFTFRKILENDELFNEIFLILFPERKTLRLLLDYFKVKSKEMKIYNTLYQLLERKLETN